VLTDQTSAHDALLGYVPDGMTSPKRARCAAAIPKGYVRRVAGDGAAREADARAAARGAVTFDYGNNLRGQARDAGSRTRSTSRASCPSTSARSSAKGGPFRWVALSGDPQDIAKTDELVLREFSHDEALPLDPPRARARRVPGPAGAHLLARLRRAREVRADAERPGARAASSRRRS
jgi:urocanate hydratase